MSLNNMVMLIGYVGQDVKTKQVSSGAKKTVLRVATHERAGKNNIPGKWTTTWHNVVAWEDIAEHAERSLVKGSHVRINGRICYSKYIDSRGHTRHVTEIKADYIQNLDR